MGENSNTDIQLAAKGLIQVTKFVVLLWDEKNKWTADIVDSEKEAISYNGYGDFAGYNQVLCIIPAST